ncbi:nitrogen fixation protein NifH [Candidatus Bipolaricaulota bacterium]|nr:nitrogen fixation protein NifH [Candidatus Bipolaricaulota bacterium]
MDGWRSLLHADPVDWLLEDEYPSVRLQTLTDVLDLPDSDARVVGARRLVMQAGIVSHLLDLQEPGGYWGEADRFYVDKYRGTVWQLLILAELAADPAEPRIRAACEFILDNSQDLASGGFSAYRSAMHGGGRHREVIPCLTGNMVWSLIRLGYLHDDRVQRGIDWITAYQRFDDGIEEVPTGWPYDKAEPCWGRHTCHMGIVKALKALAEIPESQRTTAVVRTIDEGVEYLLKHRVYKRSHDLNKISKPGWTRFGFPLMYPTDVLEILDILTKLGCRDARMQDAMDLVLSKQQTDGRWTLESTFNGKFWIDIEAKNSPSKWVTLRALRVLKRFDGLQMASI